MHKMLSTMGKRNGMSGTYNRCPDCGSLRKRHMPLNGKKVCIDCYGEYVGDDWLKKQKEKIE